MREGVEEPRPMLHSLPALHDFPLPTPTRTIPPLMMQLASSPAGAVGELLWHAAPALTVTGTAAAGVAAAAAVKVAGA